MIISVLICISSQVIGSSVDYFKPFDVEEKKKKRTYIKIKYNKETRRKSCSIS